MSKKILVINLGWEQEPLLDKLCALDIEIYGIHYNNSYYKKPRYKDVLVCDVRDLDAILKYAKTIRPDAVISDECDYSYFAQSLIAEKYGLKGAKIEQAQLAVNKYLQRMKAHNNGILVPTFRLCTSKEEVEAFGSEVGYPIITKPVDNRGSFGVNKIESKSEVEYAFYDALINSHSRLVIAEKYIYGTHITVDGYCFVGVGAKALACASKTKLKDKGYLIDEEIIYPAQLPEHIYQKALSNAEATASALGFDFGFFHGEFIVEGENIYLTEMANRGGGVYTSEIIVQNVSGVPVLDAYISDVLGGEPLQIEKIDKKPTMLRFFKFGNEMEGTIKNIKGIDVVESNPNVLKLKILIKPGDKISTIKSGADRHGMIIITSNSVDGLQKELQNSIDALKVILE